MLKYSECRDEARCLGEDSDIHPKASVRAVGSARVKTAVVEVRDYLPVHHSSHQNTVELRLLI